MYESVKHIKCMDPAVIRVLQPHEKMPVASRTRVTLTEDRYRSSAEVVENANELSRA